ncbi:chemotaxis protein CheC [Halobacteria archaeon AArc-dxtr1]|nr:chemotaxis protein CheC [Halobacteria archaeon AArc-dxtr1]
MEIDIHSLKTYNDLAREGAESAADALAALVDIETRVEVTTVALMTPSDLRHAYGDQDLAGVSASLRPLLAGETVLAFDAESRETITNELVPGDDPSMAESAITETGNIMLNGFIGGWADHLETKVEVSPPEYIEGTGTDVLPTDAADGDAYRLVFESRVEAVGRNVTFRMLLFPRIESVDELLESPTDEGVPLERLSGFTEMTERGASRAAENVTAMTGIETTVAVNRLRFMPVTDIPAAVGNEHRIGSVVAFHGTPSGYLAILFDRASARTSVDALLPVESEPWDDREQSALEELCNLITSGFIDGWANVLETSISHSPPTFVADMGASIVSPLIADLGRTQTDAFVLDSTIETDGDQVLECQLLALPHREELEAALQGISLDRTNETRADPADFFAK